MMAVFSFMTGVICVLMGLLAEMVTRTFHESQGKSIYIVRSTRNVRPGATITEVPFDASRPVPSAAIR